jgi:hypothetical protein
MTIIKVHSKNKSTTIRISEKTKKMLEALAKGKETHQEIILRLIKQANSLSTDYGSKIIEKGHVIGTQYEKLHKTIEIEIADKKYSVVCTYNDLSLIVILRSNQLKNLVGHNLPFEWELDLEIVNVRLGAGWLNPSSLNGEERTLLYIICVKQVLEETFDIELYQFETKEDYLDIMKWSEVYDHHHLSRDSFNSDIRKKLR